MKNNFRTYGSPPFRVVVLHGGPGAIGEVAPVAVELSSTVGILEPFQTASTIEDQITELTAVLHTQAALPCILIGYSWGAWLGCIIAARFPRLIQKLLLISSGPFEEEYVPSIASTRLSRLNESEQAIFKNILKLLMTEQTEHSSVFSVFHQLLLTTDCFDPLPDDTSMSEFNYSIYQQVSKEAAEMRKLGKLLKVTGQIECPVIAIHGAHDPHPYEGVRKPLSHTIKNFHFVLLDKCGHKPWQEKQAKEKFYELVKKEIRF